MIRWSFPNMFSFVGMFLKPHLHFILTIRKTTKDSYVVEYVFKDLHARPDFRSQEDLLLVFFSSDYKLNLIMALTADTEDIFCTMFLCHKIYYILHESKIVPSWYYSLLHCLKLATIFLLKILQPSSSTESKIINMQTILLTTHIILFPIFVHFILN